ncbi:uncharacterized protein An01g14610 [Aspergillus niger]|uniref:Contig An01c0470, genomic contig n=2 Tax=Aspergillus niger TaxID=5061 RepID=A2QBB0_ASPNC|nr:uncharacterized protein An01g14610 [Aspergillus niger]CAK44158.1 unnamed protein product [Aspergillus niger]
MAPHSDLLRDIKHIQSCSTFLIRSGLTLTVVHDSSIAERQKSYSVACLEQLQHDHL